MSATRPLRERKYKKIRTINERLRANKQIILSKLESGLLEILYSLRVGKKKEGKSPFEKHMGKEPKTVKSNVVKGLMDFSEQDQQLELNSSDFRSRRRKSQRLKTGTIVQQEVRQGKTAHTITFLPESSSAPKVVSKKQKDKVAKSRRRSATIAETTTSSSENDEQPKKKPSKKRNQQVTDIAFEFEEATRPHLWKLGQPAQEKEKRMKQRRNNKQKKTITRERTTPPECACPRESDNQLGSE